MACCELDIFGQVIEFSRVERNSHVRWKALTKFGWLEEGVPYDTSHHSHSVKSILEKSCHGRWKVLTIFEWLEEGVPLWNTQGVLGK